jgi:hypothetical protein
MKNNYLKADGNMNIHKNKLIYVLAAVIMMFLSGCGGDSTSSSDYDTALFMTYACTNPDEPMNDIVYGDLMNAVDAILSNESLQAYLYNYYIEHSELPSSVDLIALQEQGEIDLPDGITSGVLAFSLASATSWGIDATLKFNGFDDSSVTYSGTLKVQDLMVTVDQESGELEVTDGTFEASSLTTVNDSDNYETKYSLYSVDATDIDSNYPDLNIDGTVTVTNTDDDATYEIVFSYFSFTQSSDEVSDISGTFSIGGNSFEVDGSSITRDDNYFWTDGTLTINAENSEDEDADDNGIVEITVTFDDTTATLTKTSEEWELDNWCEDRLIP